MLGLAREECLAARGDDREPADVVARQSVFAAGEPMAASERQASDADARAGAGGDHDSLLEEGLVHVDQSRPCVYRGRVRSVVDSDHNYPCLVDYDPLADRLVLV